MATYKKQTEYGLQVITIAADDSPMIREIARIAVRLDEYPDDVHVRGAVTQIRRLVPHPPSYMAALHGVIGPPMSDEEIAAEKAKEDPFIQLLIDALPTRWTAWDDGTCVRGCGLRVGDLGIVEGEMLRQYRSAIALI